MTLVIRKNNKVMGWFKMSQFTTLTLLPLQCKVLASRVLALLPAGTLAVKGWGATQALRHTRKGASFWISFPPPWAGVRAPKYCL